MATIGTRQVVIMVLVILLNMDSVYSQRIALGLALGHALLLSTPARGQTTRLEILPSQGGKLELRWTNQPPGLMLEMAERLASPVTWQPAPETPLAEGDLRTVSLTPAGTARFYRLRGGSFTIVEESSPAPGESGVSLTRETILRFSLPLAAGTQLTTERFHTLFGGRKLLSRVELSGDRRQATLFYLEPLPAGSRVVATLVGDGLQDGSGQELDADGDGQPGGTYSLSFDTMSTAGLPGTAVIGHVFASDPIPNGDGVTNRPLGGVTVTVDGAEERLRAVTDEHGYFNLGPCPAGRFFVHIDGRTAWESNWPDGVYYPFVGKTFEAVAGRTNNLAGGTGEIFLPLVKAGTLQPVSATQPTQVTFPQGVLAEHPELAGVSLTVPANALFADDGTRGGRVGIAPVASDRIPSPLPPGLAFPLVFTIQTDGPSNFDQPVGVRFPNLPDPATGAVLPPGAKSALWSYNHDTGRWEVQGSMTVTPDGKFVETDAGVGIRQPGWHASAPGSAGSGGGGNNGPCENEQQALEDALFSCAFGIGLGLLEVAPAIGCGISLASAVNGMISGCSDPQSSCAGAVAYNAFFGAAGCIPGPVGGTIGTFAGLLQCSIELGAAVGDLAACQSINSAPAKVQTLSRAHPSAPVSNDLQDQLLQSSSSLVTSILGDAAWLGVAAADHANTTAFANALVAALAAESDGGARLTAAEQNALLALPAPGGLSLEARTALLTRFDRFAQGGITPQEQQTIGQAANALMAHSTQAQELGWETMLDGMMDSWAELVTEFSARATSQAESRQARTATALASQSPSPRRTIGPAHERMLYYRVIDQVTGLVRHGQTDASGRLAQLILGPDRPHILTYLDPLTLEVGSIFFQAGAPGGRIFLPLARLVKLEGLDADGDGLTDLQEAIVGTNPTAADSDGDGANDLVEVQQGQNPLDGLALGEGVVASLALGGRALGLHLEGSSLFVANGLAGLSVINVENPLRPVLLGQLDLPGESYDVTYSPEQRVVTLVATPEQYIPGERGLVHFVDVADPAAPRLLRSYSLPTTAVEAWNGKVYVALGQYAAKEVRIYEPGSALEVGRFVTEDYPTGLRVAGGRAYVATLSGLEIFDATLPQPVRLGRLAGEFSVEALGRVHLVLEGSTLFVAKAKGPVTIDVSDPAAPAYVGLPIANAPVVRSLALNGAGRMLALTGGTPTGNPQGAAFFSIYNVTDPANLGEFEFSLSTPGRARDLVSLSGLALVADDTAGLTVLNFTGQDTARQAPALSLDSAGLDEDRATPGVQVREGGHLEVSPSVKDDLQLERIELLVNGELAQTGHTYPARFGVDLPLLAAGSSNVVLQFRAVDRAGNAALGQPIPLELVRDVQPPALVHSLPAQGGAAYLGQPFALEYSEPLDPAALDAPKVTLLALGADAAPGGGDDVEIPLTGATASGATAQLTFPAQLTPGRYRLTSAAGFARDRAGNPTTQDQVITFDLVDASPGTSVWISDLDGQFDEPVHWLFGRVPTHDDNVLLERFGAKPVVTVDSTAIVKSIRIGTPLTSANRANLNVLGDLTASERVDVPDGYLSVGGSALFEQPLTVNGGQVQASGRLETKSTLSLSQGGSLTLSGPDAKLVPTGGMTGANFILTAKDGAVVDLPGFVQYDGPGDFTPLFPVGSAFRAQGAGSRLTLVDMEAANGPVDWNVRGAPSISFEAVSGGELRLPKLARLTGRTRVVASGFGSVLDAPLLANVSGPDSDFRSVIEADGQGLIQGWIITNLVHCDVTLDSEGVLRGNAIDLGETASLRGTGALAANLVARGAMRLDGVPGSLVIDGDLTLTATSVLEATFGLGAARDEAGRLEVKGATALAGTLKLVPARNYAPSAGQQFQVAVFSQAPTGAFAQQDDTGLGAAVKAEASGLPAELRVTLSPR